MDIADEENVFIMAGDGPYTNRGCEAIVRGSVDIIRRFFVEPRFLVVSNFHSKRDYLAQCRLEHDPAITHKRSQYTFGSGRFLSPTWWAQAVLSRTMPTVGQSFVWRDMVPYLPKASAVLSVGGDNYSLDYGVPSLFMGLNDLIMRSGKPPVLWGASVGPFDSQPDIEKVLIKQLSRAIIFAREPLTVEYLHSRGLKNNVYRVADPAFVMEPVPPAAGFKVAEGAIGINLSPLAMKLACGGDYQTWVQCASGMVECLSKRAGRPIYLVPHEMSAHTDDYKFLRNAHLLLKERGIQTFLVPGDFNAAELKWIIGQMSVFAGARTHSTIAAISSGVPTLSIGYSIKAQGINKDVFGDLDFCLFAKGLRPELFSERVMDILSRSDGIREHIHSVMPRIEAMAMEGGRLLKEVVVDGKNQRLYSSV